MKFNKGAPSRAQVDGLHALINTVRATLIETLTLGSGWKDFGPIIIEKIIEKVNSPKMVKLKKNGGSLDSVWFSSGYAKALEDFEL